MAGIWILYMWISIVDSTWHPYAQQPMLLFIMRMLYIRLKYVEFRLYRDRRHHHKWSISVQTVPIIKGKINKEDTGNMHGRNSVTSN